MKRKKLTNTTNKKLEIFKEKVREAIANYMSSEGCSCCRDIEQHKINAEVLAKLLDVPPYEDGSGYNFYQFCSDKKTNWKKVDRGNGEEYLLEKNGSCVAALWYNDKGYIEGNYLSSNPKELKYFKFKNLLTDIEKAKEEAEYILRKNNK
jgi:hypothetical protein